MLGVARTLRFSGERRFPCGEKLARLRDGLRRRRFSVECSRTARAVELMVPGDFFCSLMMLCYCVLHLRHFVHWNCCIEEMRSLLDLLEFEGSLARKLRFHLFISWNLKEASHDSFVFTYSTLGI